MEVAGVMNHETDYQWLAEEADEVKSYDHESMNIDDVDIRDDFMFAYIVRNPEICIVRIPAARAEDQQGGVLPGERSTAGGSAEGAAAGNTEGHRRGV